MKLQISTKEISKLNTYHTCLAVISLGSVPEKDENYYLQVLLINFLNVFKHIE